MSNSTDPIKILASRFASLPASVRMGIAKRLLALRDSDQAATEVAPSDGMLKKSILEHLWDEVAKAHGDSLNAVNPFTEERGLRVLEVEAVDVVEIAVREFPDVNGCSEQIIGTAVERSERT